MVAAFLYSTSRTASRLLSGLAILVTSVAAAVLLLPRPLADVFYAGWVAFSVSLAIVGGIGAWTNRTPLVWVAALSLTGLSILGMWSIGLFIAPGALLLLGAAVLSQRARRRDRDRQTVVADPPRVREAIAKTGLGVAAVISGSVLVYLNAIARELFGACASETVGCVVATTQWDGVGVTVLGLGAVGFGAWLLWKQLSVAGLMVVNQVD